MILYKTKAAAAKAQEQYRNEFLDALEVKTQGQYHLTAAAQLKWWPLAPKAK